MQEDKTEKKAKKARFDDKGGGDKGKEENKERRMSTGSLKKKNAVEEKDLI